MLDLISLKSVYQKEKYEMQSKCYLFWGGILASIILLYVHVDVLVHVLSYHTMFGVL